MRNFLLIKTTLPGILLAICALFLTPETASAQWRVGASAGADYNWYSINVNYQTDYRYDGAWGWSGAVFGQYNFMEWLGLRAELEAILDLIENDILPNQETQNEKKDETNVD